MQSIYVLTLTRDYTLRLNQITSDKKVLIEELPDVYKFLYFDDKQISPTAQQAMEEEREVRQGWLLHPQIGISTGQSMIDVGSRYGEYTLMALALGADFVYAFDKSSLMTKHLRDNLRINANSYGQFNERCSVLNRIISPIGMSIDHFVFNELSVMPKNLKWIKIDVGGQDELNIVEGAIKTIEYYRPISVLIHHYDAKEPQRYSEQFLAANAFDCKMVAIQRKNGESEETISTTMIY